MLNRANTPDLSYHPRRSVEPQMKTMRHGTHRKDE